MAWKNLHPVATSAADKLFKSEVEQYAEEVIRKHVNAFNDNTIDHHFQLPCQFTIEEIKCDPVEDTFGCFGEVQRVLALVKFKPQSRNYYKRCDYKKLDLSGIRTFFLPKDEIPEIDTEEFNNILFSFARDHSELILLRPLTADEVKECHTLIYNSLRNRNDKHDPWQELKPYLTYGGNPCSTYSTDSIKNKINYIICSLNNEPEGSEKQILNKYESYAKNFRAAVQRYQNAKDRILHYLYAKNQNAHLPLDKWNESFYIPSVYSYIKYDVDYSDTDASQKLISARNDYESNLRTLCSNMENARASYDKYRIRRERAEINIRKFKGDITEKLKAEQEYMFCKGAIQGVNNLAAAEYEKFKKLASEYQHAAITCYQADKLEIIRIARELNILMKDFPRR